MNKNKQLNQQDHVLLRLYKQDCIEDWVEISNLLMTKYNFAYKNPKQCQQRYINYLTQPLIKVDWTQQEQQIFIRLHQQIGNKWSLIAQNLIQKTDNCVKNHFYSKLRKLLRRLNKIIQYYFKKEFRALDITLINKIVQASEERFKNNPNCQLYSLSIGVENKMLYFAIQIYENSNKISDDEFNEKEEMTQAKLQEYRQLIQQIFRVSKLYKRKSKKVRNSSIQAPVNHGKKKYKKTSIDFNSNINVDKKKDQQSNSSKMLSRNQASILYKKKLSFQYQLKLEHNISENQYSGSVYEGEDDSQRNKIKKKSKIIQNNKYKHKAASRVHEQLCRNGNDGRVHIQEDEGIHELLRTAGILYNQPQKIEQSGDLTHRKCSINSCLSNMNPLKSSPSLYSHSQQILFSNHHEYTLNTFTSEQVEQFMGISMMNTANSNTQNNSFNNFTLSEKSSFRSYSEVDLSDIESPF